jgi:raffinose/stachyose/melibiose transport system substrate-binding protein
MQVGRSRHVALGALTALAVVASAFTGSSVASDSARARAAANPFAHYGNITLKVWSADNQDPGPEPVIKQLSANFSKKYPNVKIELTFKGFTDYMKVIQLALNGNSAPDVAEGNQGFATDALLVKAKLIRPLDSYAKKYGWLRYYTPGTAAQFRWTPDGKTFGKGNLWGVGQFGQSTGIFYNKAKLKQFGYDPAKMPTTFAAFDKMVTAIRAKDDKSDPVIVLGNKDGYESVHAWGMIQGAFTSGSAMRDWIFHKKGASFDNAGNLKALEVLQRWTKANVFGSDYNAVNENDASAAFAKGKGVFYMGGNWQAAVIKAGLGADAGFMDGPPGTSGKHVAIGSTSLPWHVSAKTKYPDVAAAYTDYLISAPGSAKLMYAQNQIPAIQGAPAAGGDPYLSSVAKGWQTLVKDDGLTLFPDWSSDTMLTTLGTSFQKLMAGRAEPKDVLSEVQSDWSKFDKSLAKT